MATLGRGLVPHALLLALCAAGCIPPPAAEPAKPAASKPAHDADISRFNHIVELSHQRCLHLLEHYHQPGGKLWITTSATLHADGSIAEVTTERSDHGPLPDADVRCIEKGVRSGAQFASPQPEGRRVSWQIIYH